MRRTSSWALIVASVLLLVGAAPATASPAAGAATADAPADVSTRSAAEQQLAAQVPELQARLGSAFGGAWFDEGGVLHVGVVGPVTAASSPGVSLDAVEHSAAALAAQRDAITADLVAGTLDHLGIATIDVRPQIDRVVVGVTGDPAAAASELTARYGDGITAEATAAPVPADRITDQPLKSGLQITSAQGGGTVGCSSAFGTHVGAQKYVMTAGHCQETTSSAAWRIGQSAPAFGASTRKTFVNGSAADSLAITAPSAKAGPRDCVFESDSTCRTVAGYAGTLLAGQTVCKSGYRTDVSCGQILTPDTTVNYSSEGVRLVHMAAACGVVNSGDSGSGMYRVLGNGSAVVAGILSGSTSDSACPAVPLPYSLDGASNVIFFTPWRSAVRPGVGFPVRSGYREVGDINGDPCADLLATYQGYLFDYPGGCNGTFAGGGVLFGSGWDAFDTILRPGDFNADGCSDIIGRTPDGRLLLYYGNCAGGVINGVGVLIGTGWSFFTNVLTPGDFSGDGCADLIGRTSDGRLLLYYGDCNSHFVNGVGVLAGTGFESFDKLITPGDWTGDGCVDLLGRFPDGALRAYYGDCQGHLVGSGPDNAGWGAFDTIVGIGDWTGDGCTDLLARFPSGTLRWYGGNCAGGFAGSVDFNTGWQIFSTIQ